jgi:apolipoprotein N-acyltransferase
MESGTTSGVVAVGPARLGLLLCYESAFPRLAREAVDDGATLLVNLSNDAWFVAAGASQAVAFARLRAIETRRALVRVASGGASAVVAPSGRVVWAAPSGRASAEVVEVPLREGRTAYVAAGDAIVWVAWVVVLLASFAPPVPSQPSRAR